MLTFLLRRLRRAQSVEIILATTDLAVDDELAVLAAQEKIAVYRGSENDLVTRYVGAAEQFGLDTVARVTADCPFVDAELVDWCVARAAEFDHFDLATTKGHFPVGLDVEIYRADTMAILAAEVALSTAHREHLTLYFYDSHDRFAVRRICLPPHWNWTPKSFTVDTAADWSYARALAEQFQGPGISNTRSSEDRCHRSSRPLSLKSMTILTEYSKSSADVAVDTALMIEDDESLRARQHRIAQALCGCPPRETCVICAGSLAEAVSFNHRNISYVRCSSCGHVQSSMEPPEGYPYAMQDFADVYRPLVADAYRDRTKRIYLPKLAWMLRAALATGMGNLLDRSWVDVGCGAGLVH